MGSSEEEKSDPQPSDGADFVTITVPSGQKFAAHAHMLTYHSEYFNRALNSRFREATTRTLDLSVHATEATVSTFVKWMYSKNMDFLNGIGEAGMAYDILFDSVSDKDAVESWLFGDYIQATSFRNDLLFLLYFRRHCFNHNVAGDIWDRIPLESKLRPFLVSLLCRRIIWLDDVDMLLESLPPTLVLEVSKRVYNRMTRTVPRYSYSSEEILDFKIEDHLEDV
ncbi:hypothetical protein F5Y13DRAFT_198503 [Hypoxylon sp. FL1857]|nr:hypothetical protein F5Y13DRAFT_198503 [Hypoxylon sp. FL1857]